MRKKIFIFSTTRAEYSLLKNLAFNLQKIKRFEINFIASGTHLSKKFGSTLNEIKKDQIKNLKKIKIKKIENYTDINTIFLQTMKKAGDFLKKKKIDLVIILGDRFEMLAISLLCFFKKIPICHIHGGEKTLGAIDNSIRNIISSISQYHFTANKEFKKNVKKIVGNNCHVESVGALCLDNIYNFRKISQNEIEKKYKFKFMKKKLILTLHPETLAKISPLKQIKTVLSAINYFKDIQFIITAPNIDPGSKVFFREISKYKSKNNNIIFIRSLGSDYYHSLLQYSNGVLGNSSSGIIEVPYHNKGTINIGDRQKGRPIEKSIINCSFNKFEIIKSIKKLYSKKFQHNLMSFKANKYGSPGATDKITKTIKNIF